jgi:hypothetical protein
MKPSSKAARRIQSEINEVLFQYWDPIGLNGALPKDEYARYVAAVYRALADGAGEFQIIRLLTDLEPKIGCQASIAKRREAARRLCALDLALEDGIERK